MNYQTVIYPDYEIQGLIDVSRLKVYNQITIGKTILSIGSNCCTDEIFLLRTNKINKAICIDIAEDALETGRLCAKEWRVDNQMIFCNNEAGSLKWFADVDTLFFYSVIQHIGLGVTFDLIKEYMPTYICIETHSEFDTSIDDIKKEFTECKFNEIAKLPYTIPDPRLIRSFFYGQIM